MKDRKIIIDSVDVSGCIYFKKNNKMSMCRACNSGVGTPYCEYHKDCYYKQLKAKEQERYKYKQALDEIEYLVTELFLGAEDKDRIYCEKILDIINNVKEG